MLAGGIKSAADPHPGDIHRTMPWFCEETFANNLDFANAIAFLAKRKVVSSSQLSLAWLLAEGNDIFPIPRTTRQQCLEENTCSLEVQLTMEEVEATRKVCREARIAGEQYRTQQNCSCFESAIATLNLLTV